MKKLLTSFTALVILVAGFMVWAADHIDAPAVGSLSTGSTIADITDFYAFESPVDANNYVFVCNVMGLTAPSATGGLEFDENVMYEINIDTDADNVEDLVIQTIFRDGKAIVFGPVAPTATGRNSNIENSGSRIEVDVTDYQAAAVVASSNGVSVFAGPRDDPFFMDFFRFVDIVNGAGASLGLDVPDPEDGVAYATSFNSTGQDTFAGTNVLSVVIEIPKSMIGGNGISSFSSWAESKRKQ